MRLAKGTAKLPLLKDVPKPLESALTLINEPRNVLI